MIRSILKANSNHEETRRSWRLTKEKGDSDSDSDADAPGRTPPYSPLLVPLSVSVALDRLPPLSPVHSIDGDLEASHAASSAPTLPTLSTKPPSEARPPRPSPLPLQPPCASFVLPREPDIEPSTPSWGGDERQPFVMHVICASGVETRAACAEEVAEHVEKAMGRADAITWVELHEAVDALALRSAFRGGAALHPIAERLLLATNKDATTYPFVERTAPGWTVWSALLPHAAPERRVRYAAACTDRLVVSASRVGGESHAPVGGWWKSKRRGSTSAAALFPRTAQATACEASGESCLFGTGSGRRRQQRRRRRRRRECPAHYSAALLDEEAPGCAAVGVLSDFEEDESEGCSDSSSGEWRCEGSLCDRGALLRRHSLRSALCRFRADASERERAARLGGPYCCAKLVESALLEGRASFREFDETISRLSEVCSDEKPGWRHRRVRFNRTVRILLEAGKARTQISRLREYYDQAYHVAKTAAAIWAQPPVPPHTSRSLEQHSGTTTAAAAHRTTRAAQLAPWMRDLSNLAHGDLRRLHQQDGLLHSYLLLARLRHEDDYTRVNVLLSLVATIFLPLSFLTGVFGMNFSYIPLLNSHIAFAGFFGVTLAIVIFALGSFWYRGWLNVLEPVNVRVARRRAR